MVVRPYNEELTYLEKKTPYKWEIKKGFQPNMNVCNTCFRFLFEMLFVSSSVLNRILFLFVGGGCVLC